MVTGSGPCRVITDEERRSYLKNEEQELEALFDELGFKGTKVWREDDGSMRASGLAPEYFSFQRNPLDIFREW